MKKIINEKVPIKIWTNEIEEEALEQLKNTARLPFVFKHIAVMPDVHTGIGATVGSVIATKGAVCPAAVGVDIGCGMRAIQTTLDYRIIQDNIKEIRKRIEELVPVGFEQHKESSMERQIAIAETFESFRDYVSGVIDLDKAAKQLGTLGGGNHFIEICLDTCDSVCNVWILIHTGSRNAGKVTADHFINKAKGFMKDLFISLPDPDLAYFAQSQIEFQEYISVVNGCQDYALKNRNYIEAEVVNAIYEITKIDRNDNPFFILQRIDCHHNYLARENHFGQNVWITRKGAVSARSGQFGIIPGSMGTKSYIVKGLGNPESFCSCSHGAGRKMSRKKARNTFTQQDFINQTQGIECRKDDNVIDEIPGAYKDINEVMENQKDLVEIVYELKQIMCVKG